MLKKIWEIDKYLAKIESAAHILDESLSRELTTFRRCALMEAIPFCERKKSLAFANAMTAIEGIPASIETEKNLSRWTENDFSFQDSFINILRTYHLTEI